MHLNLMNRVALTTGTSQGIYRSTAIQLANEGVRIAIISNDYKNLKEAADETKNLELQ